MLKSFIRGFPLAQVVKWAAIGVGFMGLSLPLLYVLRSRLLLPLPVATLISAAIAVTLKFLFNDRLVFRHRRPSWSRLKAYYAASALGFGVWYAVANLLPRLGLHYLVSAVFATSCSVTFNLVSNFFWVWRTRAAAAPALPADFPEKP